MHYTTSDLLLRFSLGFDPQMKMIDLDHSMCKAKRQKFPSSFELMFPPSRQGNQLPNKQIKLPDSREAFVSGKGKIVKNSPSLAVSNCCTADFFPCWHLNQMNKIQKIVKLGSFFTT